MPDAGILVATFDALAYLVICHVIGTAILLAVRVNVRGLVPPSALIGCAALAIQLWAFGFAHLPWNIFTLLLPWVAVFVVLRRPLRQTLQTQIKSALALLARLRGVEPLSGVLIAIAALLLVVYGLNAFLHPAGGWDAIAFWYFKAKVFFVDQHVDPASPAFVSIPRLFVVRNLEYPPLYPLMLASTFVVSGRVNEALSNSINLLALVAAVPTMYSLVRRLVGSRLGIVFVFLLIAMAIPPAWRFFLDGGYFGHADYVEAIWILLTLIYLQAGESGDGAADVMAVACAVGAALTKDEGTPLLFVTLGVLILRQAWRWKRWQERPALRNLAIAAACVLPVLIWHLTWSLSGKISPLMLNHNPLSLLPQLPSRAATIVRYVAAIPHNPTLSALSTRVATGIGWNTYVWMALALPMSLLLLAFNRFRTGAAIGVVLGLQLLAYFVVYLFTPIDLTEHLSESADRVILQLAPSVILLLAVSISPYLGAFWRDVPGRPHADEQEPAA